MKYLSLAMHSSRTRVLIFHNSDSYFNRSLIPFHSDSD